jgi:hypothetical protein
MARQQAQSKSLDQLWQKSQLSSYYYSCRKMIAATISDTNFKTYVAVHEQPLRAIKCVSQQ